MATPKAQENRDSIHLKKQEFVRHEIWVAAMEMFCSAGYDETTIDQIAAKANVSRRTFFRYFSSKDDVMAATMKGYGAALVRTLKEQPASCNPFDAAKAVAKRVARLAADSPYAEQMMRIGEKSADARSAQILALPVIEDELGSAFASRLGEGPDACRTACLLASVTLSVTKMSIAQWLKKPQESIESVVDGAFASLKQIFGKSEKSKA
jgi:AcrR family transcriptional regulator